MPETVPEEENSDTDGGHANRRSCLYLQTDFKMHVVLAEGSMVMDLTTLLLFK